jgi:hypothetical protein
VSPVEDDCSLMSEYEAKHNLDLSDVIFMNHRLVCNVLTQILLTSIGFCICYFNESEVSRLTSLRYMAYFEKRLNDI